jgi:hypothetical protein
MRRLIFVGILVPVLSGCVAKTLIDVATAPVRIAGKAADLATTSQSEADENRGRELRKLEERYGELERDYRRENLRCSEGRSQSCKSRDEISAEMDEIRPQLPVKPD